MDDMVFVVLSHGWPVLSGSFYQQRSSSLPNLARALDATPYYHLRLDDLTSIPQEQLSSADIGNYMTPGAASLR